MKVKELVSVMDKSIVFMVFQASHNELIFDSTDWDRVNYTRKNWIEIGECEVAQFSTVDSGEGINIYISPISALKLKTEVNS